MITAILNVYRRPELLRAQVKALRVQTAKPAQLWIWQNQAPEDVKVKVPIGCVFVKSNRNFYYHGRFALALLAQTEYVMVLDDDIIPGKKWIENCLNCMNEKPGLYVGVGRRMPGRKGDRQWFGWRNPNEAIEEVDYGGHCWFLKKDWLRIFWLEPPVNLTNAEDMQLSFALQRAGIKTYVPPHPEDKDLWSNTIGWEHGKSKVASQKNPPTGIGKKEWFKERRAIRRECVNRGWELMRNGDGNEEEDV
ncbi:MAG: glycosyltransferase [Phycisphaerae bacterium]|jgi:hypothetical protein